MDRGCARVSQMREANADTIESLIAGWRAYLGRKEAVHAADLEGRLHEQVAALRDAGLTDDEAFLIAVKRVGETDAASREFVREHFERLWEQPESALEDDDDNVPFERTEFVVVIGLAVAAALAIKVPELFGYRLIDGDGVYARNLSLFVLPMLAGYFAWKRGLGRRESLWLVLPFVAAAVFANIFPFKRDAHTESLTAIHLPFALWLVVGFAYVGGRWRSVERRTDFVRFSGELFIYYVLIALGGGVFSLLTWGMFEAIDLDVGDLIAEWVLPCGAMGAVLRGRMACGEAAERHAEHRADACPRVHTVVRRDVAGVPRSHGLDGRVDRHGQGYAHRFRYHARSGARTAALLRLGAGHAGAPRRLRRVAAALGSGRHRSRPHGALRDCGTHLRVRFHAQQDGSIGREPRSARQLGVVGLALYAIPEWARRVFGSCALAGQLPARLCRVGGGASSFSFRRCSGTCREPI